MPSSALTPSAALAVVSAIRAHFADCLAQKTPELTAELARVLTLLEDVDFTQADATHLRATHHPVITQLKSPALAAATDNAILAACLPHLDALPWRYSYDARADHPGLETRMAWRNWSAPSRPSQASASASASPPLPRIPCIPRIPTPPSKPTSSFSAQRAGR
jgi:hypothetical protein